jgi:hypothetical protein
MSLPRMGGTTMKRANMVGRGVLSAIAARTTLSLLFARYTLHPPACAGTCTSLLYRIRFQGVWRARPASAHAWWKRHSFQRHESTRRWHCTKCKKRRDNLDENALCVETSAKRQKKDLDNVRVVHIFESTKKPKPLSKSVLLAARNRAIPRIHALQRIFHVSVSPADRCHNTSAEHLFTTPLHNTSAQHLFTTVLPAGRSGHYLGPSGRDGHHQGFSRRAPTVSEGRQLVHLRKSRFCAHFVAHFQPWLTSPPPPPRLGTGKTACVDNILAAQFGFDLNSFNNGDAGDCAGFVGRDVHVLKVNALTLKRPENLYNLLLHKLDTRGGSASVPLSNDCAYTTVVAQESTLDTASCSPQKPPMPSNRWWSVVLARTRRDAVSAR